MNRYTSGNLYKPTRMGTCSLSWTCKVSAACLTLFLLAVGSPCRAAEPPAASQPTADLLNPWHYYHLARQGLTRVQPPEIAEMVWAIAHGSQMGPGEGWFHASQSRYGWQWLVEHFDANHDGRVDRQEFPGDSALFNRLDRNHDGVLTAADFDWSEKSPLLRESRLAAQWLRLIDTNSNGRISRAEWEAFFAKAAKGKDHLTADDLREALNPPQPPPSNATKDGPSPLVFFKGLLVGELGSWHEGPAIGDPAPDFSLKTQDGKRTIALADLRGKKPIVLIFGSFT
jgi:hypothetical protein